MRQAQVTICIGALWPVGGGGRGIRRTHTAGRTGRQARCGQRREVMACRTRPLGFVPAATHIGKRIRSGSVRVSAACRPPGLRLRFRESARQVIRGGFSTGVQQTRLRLSARGVSQSQGGNSGQSQSARGGGRLSSGLGQGQGGGGQGRPFIRNDFDRSTIEATRLNSAFRKDRKKKSQDGEGYGLQYQRLYTQQGAPGPKRRLHPPGVGGGGVCTCPVARPVDGVGCLSGARR